MLLTIILVLACSAGECPIDGPGSPMGPDAQAFLALQKQARPMMRLQERAGDARVAADPAKALSFRNDPLLTWSERRLATRN